MMEVLSYIVVLKEKAFAWLDTSEQIQKLLLIGDSNSLESLISQRDEAINGYLDCLDRLELKVSSSSKIEVEVGEKFLINLLGYFETNGDSALHKELLEVKTCFNSIRKIDHKLQELAENIPKQIKNNLLDVQKKKPAVSAYQRTKFTPFSQFQRFDRSE